MPKRTWFTEFTLTPQEAGKFWPKVDRTGDCWLWLGSPNPAGYGVFTARGTTIAAHRASYMSARGPIPDGLVLDHLCRVRRCVNPDHLEPVTSQTNSRRSPLVFKSHCSEGHEFTPENTATYSIKSGGAQRYCIQCRNRRSRENQQRYRAERRERAG